jgi:hypothetical protein
MIDLFKEQKILEKIIGVLKKEQHTDEYVNLLKQFKIPDDLIKQNLTNLEVNLKKWTVEIYQVIKDDLK